MTATIIIIITIMMIMILIKLISEWRHGVSSTAKFQLKGWLFDANQSLVSIPLEWKGQPNCQLYVI